MELYLPISNLNDFIFCPISIYFHNLYSGIDSSQYQSTTQVKGTNAHRPIDKRFYSTKKDCLQSLDVYSEKYHLCGKIDVFDKKTNSLIERKREIKTIYDGYIFQLYAQYFCMIEMGYAVDNLYLYSYIDNKKYPILLPKDNEEMLNKFNQLIHDIEFFDVDKFTQENKSKCEHCIYFTSCDRGVL